MCFKRVKMLGAFFITGRIEVKEYGYCRMAATDCTFSIAPFNKGTLEIYEGGDVAQ